MFTQVVRKELKKKPILTMCVIGSAITRLLSVLFSNYLILWIQSYAGTSKLDSRERGQTIYVNIMVISVVISALVFPFVGVFIDRCDVIKLMPVAFIFRFLCDLMFMKLEDPDSYTCLTVCVLLIIGTIFENSVIDTIFTKSIPKEARGILTCL